MLRVLKIITFKKRFIINILKKIFSIQLIINISNDSGS
jgi:hypothetical protein